MDWPAYCQVCKRRFRASELRLRWDGKRVCSMDYETRHPLDLARPDLSESNLPWVSPRPEDKFISDLLCTIEGMTSKADMAVADCVIADVYPTV